MNIFKYTVQASNRHVKMPCGAKIISAQVQGEDVQLWAIVDAKAKMKNRKIVALPTGAHCDHVLFGTFVGTIQLDGGSLVFHIFDLGEEE